MTCKYSFSGGSNDKMPYFVGRCAIVNLRCLPYKGKRVMLIFIKTKEYDTSMFSENLKTLRKQKGFSQEKLAARLNVVRQTVSKWEKNLSVPDADTLIRLAEVLEVSVSELLGTKIENEIVTGDVAEQLSRINEQLAIKNRRSRRIWKAVAIVLAVIVLVNICIAVFFSVPNLNENIQTDKAAVSSETQSIDE
jgi:putative transcriptional regulator